MNILGIDASTKKTGFSIYYDTKLVDYGIFITDAKEVNVHTRILEVREFIAKKIIEHKIDILVIEDVPINGRNNLNVAKNLCVLQGAILDLCHVLDIGLVLYQPTAWRSLVGLYSGHREDTKRDIQKQRAVSLTNEIYGFNFHYYKTDSKTKISDDDLCESIQISRAYQIENGLLKEQKYGEKATTI